MNQLMRMFVEFLWNLLKIAILFLALGFITVVFWLWVTGKL